MNIDNPDKSKPVTVNKYPLSVVRGLPFPAVFISPETVESVMDYKPTKDDIFIVTYPKCGTTWTQFLVWGILNKGAVPPSPNQMMFKHVPFLETTGINVINDLPPPRVMKTHLPFNLQPYSHVAKYIYIVRNPWDLAVSYYHHCSLDPKQPQLSFDAFLQLFMKGEVGWGDFFDHVLSWFVHRNDSNVLFLTYEGMKKDTRKVLLKIAKFLGESYYENLIQDETVIDNCLKYSDFKYLKQQGMFFPKHDGTGADLGPDYMKTIAEVSRSTADEEKFNVVPFFRKGVVGDWKNYFSQEQIKAFKTYMTKKIKNTELENYWLPAEETTAL